VNVHFQRWVWALLLLPLLWGLWRLRFDVEVLDLLPDDVPVVRGLKLQQQYFACRDELLITLRAPSPDTAETAARQLAEALRQEPHLVAGAIWQPPWLERPEHLPEFLAFLWLNQPPARFAELVQRLSPGNLDRLLADSREQLATSLSPSGLAQLAYDPLGLTRFPGADLGGFMVGENQDWFASAEGTFRMLFVKPAPALVDYRSSAAWFGDLKAAVRRCALSPAWPDRVMVRFTGAPAFVSEVAVGMEHDLKRSILSTLLIIAALFGLVHRRALPLLWLLVLLNLILLFTIALGGLIFGTLNVVSLGFTAILLGLAVDYGLVLYQESLNAPACTPREVRRQVGRGIAGSAFTTAATFSLLNFGGMPGLSQLGSLVALGIMLAAALMLYTFLPVAQLRLPRASHPVPASSPGLPAPARQFAPWIATVLLCVLSVWILSGSWPPTDTTNQPLQLKDSPAQVALDELTTELSRQGEPLSLLIMGRDEQEVAIRLEKLDAWLAARHDAGRVRAYQLPTSAWPHPDHQATNRLAARQLAARKQELLAAAFRAGFTTNALALTEGILDVWQRVSPAHLWPTNASFQWLLDRFAARTPSGWLALGTCWSGTNGAPEGLQRGVGAATPGVEATAWSLLGPSLYQHVQHRLVWLFAGALFVIIGSLWLVFARPADVLLSLATLTFSFLLLLAVMRTAGWAWNLMNLMAVPLLLGTGVDYTIHMQLALRRHAGNLALVRRTTGRALLLCAGTTVAGFGSLACSGNQGLASLGQLCAAGILSVCFVSVFLLPAWWQVLSGPHLPHLAHSQECATAPPGRYLPARQADQVPGRGPLHVCFRPRHGHVVQVVQEQTWVHHV